MDYSNGDHYEGDWKDDKKNGKGICSLLTRLGKMDFSNGDKHEGDWKDDKMTGKGNFSS